MSLRREDIPGAVTDRGCFATGGQTQGEIWTPKQKLKARLGDKNQEHCTVYNMVRLAEFLFRQTKDPSYMHYIEYNVENGLTAQTYWQGVSYKKSPSSGLLTYFLPMKAGSRKDWAGETDSYRTENQDPGISFRMLKDIGYEPYQIYFKVKKRQGNAVD